MLNVFWPPVASAGEGGDRGRVSRAPGLLETKHCCERFEGLESLLDAMRVTEWGSRSAGLANTRACVERLNAGGQREAEVEPAAGKGEGEARLAAQL